MGGAIGPRRRVSSSAPDFYTVFDKTADPKAASAGVTRGDGNRLRQAPRRLCHCEQWQFTVFVHANDAWNGF